MFEEYANASLQWLIKEIKIANPYAIILLGLEVTKVIFKVSDSVAKSYLDGKSRLIDYAGLKQNFICLPHPGILMKRTERNPWPERFENEISVTAREEIEKLKKARR